MEFKQIVGPSKPHQGHTLPVGQQPGGNSWFSIGEALTGAVTNVCEGLGGLGTQLIEIVGQAVEGLDGQLSETTANSYTSQKISGRPTHSSGGTRTDSSSGSSRERNIEEQNRLNNEIRQIQQQLNQITHAKKNHTRIFDNITVKKQEIQKLKKCIESAQNSMNSDGHEYKATVERSQRFQGRGISEAAKVGEFLNQLGFSNQGAQKDINQKLEKVQRAKRTLDSLYTQKNKLEGELTQPETKFKNIHTFLQRNNDATVEELLQQIKNLTNQKRQMPVCFTVKKV